MEPWGIMMTGFTLFGMLALAVAAVRMDAGDACSASTPMTGEPTTETMDQKKAA